MTKRPIFLVWMGLVLILPTLACRAVFPGPAETPARITPQPRTPEEAQPVALPPVVLPPAADLVNLEDTLVQIYESVNPGVVALRVLTEEGGSRGSGFVVDLEGHIVTNYHVVEGVTDLEVAFPSGFKTRGEILGTDLDSDLAVIRVEAPAEQLHPLRLSDSDTLKVGQAVIAIGNPFGFDGTMTMGIISALGRSMESLHEAPAGGVFTAGDIIQTDAAINPGNSGGPLLNLNGEVIGVNRAIFSTNFDESGQPVSSGIGFAISINIVKKVLPALISQGSYDYPFIGITSLNDLSLLEQEALGLPRASGVYVTSVTSGGPADQAGIRGGTQSTSIPGLQAGGDLIIAIDGVEVQTFSDFISYLLRFKDPGDEVVLTVLRGDEELQIPVTLDKRPSP